MKRYFILILILFFATSAFAQKEFSKEYLETKLSSSKKMKNIGRMIGTAGIICDVVGVIMLYSHDYRNRESGNSDTKDDYLLTGNIFVGVGITLNIAGAIVYGIGKGRERTYEKLLKKYNPELSLHFTGRGLTLSFNF